jgi:HK97 family phage portal protein
MTDNTLQRVSIPAWRGPRVLGELRNMENPSNPLNDSDDGVFGSYGRASSGIPVGSQTALTYSPVWRAVNLIAGDVARCGLITYLIKRTEFGGRMRTRATAHPAYQLLLRKANREMSAFTFKMTLMGHTLIDGNGMAYILRDGGGRPRELIPILPGRATAIRANGELKYVVSVSPTTSTEADAFLDPDQLRKVDPSDMLHLKGLSYDGLMGYRTIQKARDSIGAGMAAERFGASYFKNGASPSVIIEHPQKLSSVAVNNIANSWRRMHTGIDRSHLPAVLQEGAKISSFSHNASDAQLLEMLAFKLRDVANWFGIPPHKLGDTSGRSYASIEAENLDYVNSCLDRWLTAFEQECHDKLLTEAEKQNESVEIEFRRQDLVKADSTARGQLNHLYVGDGIICVDEARETEGLDPLPNGIGRIIRAPLNTTIVADESGKLVTPPATPEPLPPYEPPPDPAN